MAQNSKEEIKIFDNEINVIQFYSDNIPQKIPIDFLEKNRINIFHFGDSHIQADLMCFQLRKLIKQNLHHYAGRGLIFPYSVAKSHNTNDFSINFSGKWESNKNIDKAKILEPGISGYVISTNDYKSKINICYKAFDSICNKPKLVKIIYKNSENQFKIFINNKGAINSGIIDNESAFSIFETENLDSIKIRFIKTEALQNNITIYGLILEEKYNGIYYHSSGVNGAKVESFLNSELFFSQLEFINPHIIIISLGANDGYTDNFDSNLFHENYSSLVKKIQNKFPNSYIVATTPGDSYNSKKTINLNNEQIKNIILNIANEYKIGIWDFYSIMGKANSINNWYKKGLVLDDKLHFNNNGYQLIGNLFFDALSKTFFD